MSGFVAEIQTAPFKLHISPTAANVEVAMTQNAERGNTHKILLLKSLFVVTIVHSTQVH
jgi:hypothetical protein